MTEDEFIEWSGDEVRAEWVDGEVVFMNAVSSDHADLAAFILHLLREFVDEQDLGKVWAEPFQVRLAKQRRRRSPDAFFAFHDRLHLLQKTQFNGSPDLIVEIVSADSRVRDRKEKFLEYQAAGVREYWLVDPLARSFIAYTLGPGGKYASIPPVEATVYSVVLPGLFFRVEWTWQLHFPKVSSLMKHMIPKGRKRPSSPKRRSSDNQSQHD